MIRRFAAVAALTMLCAGANCRTGPGTPATCNGLDLTGDEPSAAVNLSVDTLISGASKPVTLAFAPDGRLFYTEQATGQIRVVTADDQLLDTPFVDLPVNSNNERGLLGVALHPDFAQNGLVYAFYTSSTTGGDSTGAAQAEDNRVVRFASAGNVAAGGETLIVSAPVELDTRHNGGNIHFGPDGKLYVTIGDIFNPDLSQQLDALPGRILRLNDDGGIPADNPFGTDNPTFALGLRNSFDFTFDPVSGGLFATENGTNLHDEVNLLPPGSNGGWRLVEGCSSGTVNVSVGTYVDPLVQSIGTAVPTGIVFVPGTQYGVATQNTFLVAENQTGRIVRYTLNVDRTQVTAAAVFAENIAGMSDIEIGPDGLLYVCSVSGGNILKLTPVP